MKDKKEDLNIKKELEKCQKELDENVKGWQRERADFLNYKKEEAERNQYLKDFVSEEIFLDLLSVLDNFDLAENGVSDDILNNEWFQGFKMIKKQMEEFLKNHGVEEIITDNQKFNPELHEAMEFIEREDCESGDIIEVQKKGYTFKGKTLRPARVKVCK